MDFGSQRTSPNELKTERVFVEFRSQRTAANDYERFFLKSLVSTPPHTPPWNRGPLWTLENVSERTNQELKKSILWLRSGRQTLNLKWKSCFKIPSHEGNHENSFRVVRNQVGAIATQQRFAKIRSSVSTNTYQTLRMALEQDRSTSWDLLNHGIEHPWFFLDCEQNPRNPGRLPNTCPTSELWSVEGCEWPEAVEGYSVSDPHARCIEEPRTIRTGVLPVLDYAWRMVSRPWHQQVMTVSPRRKGMRSQLEALNGLLSSNIWRTTTCTA